MRTDGLLFSITSQPPMRFLRTILIINKTTGANTSELSVFDSRYASEKFFGKNVNFRREACADTLRMSDK